MTNHINRKLMKNEHKVNYIKNQLEYTILKDIVISSKIYYEPDIDKYESTIQEDNELLKLLMIVLALRLIIIYLVFSFNHTLFLMDHLHFFQIKI